MILKDLEITELNLSLDSLDYILKKAQNKKVLEIGCFNGYSSIKTAQIAKSVTTIEIDKESIKIAKQNFEKYKIKNIKLLEGDAKDILRNLNEKFDLIIIDAMKKEYKEYLILCLALINKNGLIYADNTISHKNKMNNFFDYLRSSKLEWKELGLGKGLIEIKF